MVDFQERETRRSLDEDGDLDPRHADEGAESEDGSGTPDEGGTGSRHAAGGESRADGGERRDSDADGEAEIDRVREQLEERPVTDGASESLEPPTEADELVEPDDADGEGEDHDHDADHDHHHHDVETLGAAVVTVSTSRTLADDPSGDHIVESLVDAGHEVVTRELIPDDYDDIQSVVATLVNRDDVDVVVSTGGTGVTSDDRTIEAVRPLFDKELPGFGEYFRRLSEAEIGSRVVATRATAGVAEGVPVFCLPGSRDAVALGVEEVIVEEAPHLAGLAQRDDDHDGHDESDADEADVEEAADDPFGG